MRDVTLAAGDELVLLVSADTEVFCASGQVGVGVSAVAVDWPGRILQPGQAIRCPEGGLLTLRAIGLCRFRLVEVPAPAPVAHGRPRKQNSLQQWRRRLSWGN